MAQALIANVNPIYGLYSGMLNTIVGSLTSSSSLMIISLTNALALVTGSALLNLKGEVKIEALFTLTLLVGLIQLILGLFKLGGIKRFISDSVMTGFIAAA
ncbi:MAG TPA: SulP family inorganic anion transporter, partial [Actinobacteria bacterium]|nr:SulP family inorganic anion transporter [Actinomycetes bacterium]HEX21458.1 SulP family inorganic anion transporter [Actinomycetota bacterium]